MHKHRIVYLPETALEANLDELSLQGWEFVAWIETQWHDWDIIPFKNRQRRALVRRADNGEAPRK